MHMAWRSEVHMACQEVTARTLAFQVENLVYHFRDVPLLCAGSLKLV